MSRTRRARVCLLARGLTRGSASRVSPGSLPAVWRWTSSRRRGRCKGIWFAVAMRDRKISTESLSSLCRKPRKSDPPSRRSGAPGVTVPPCWATAAQRYRGDGELRPTVAGSSFYRRFATSSIFFLSYIDLLCWQTCSTLRETCGDVTTEKPESRSE